MRHDDPIYRKVNRSSFLLSQGLFSSVSKVVVNSLPRAEQASALTNLSPVMAGVGLTSAIGLALVMVKKRGEAEDEIAESVGTIISDSASEAKEAGVSEQVDAAGKKITEFKPVPIKDEEPGIFQWIKSMFTWDKPEPRPAPAASQISNGLKDVPVSVLGSKLSKDFRSHYVFSGFSGANGVSKGGSFTQEEANLVQTLKTTGATTSATGKMEPPIEAMIRGYARKYGVPEDQALRVARMESGGNPNAISSTGAIGIYQFTGRTASDYGVTNRFDPAQNIEAGMKFMASSSSRLKNAGLSDDPISQYLVHQLGFTGARELLKAAENDKKISELSRPLQRALGKNAAAGKSATVKGYIAATQSHMDARNAVQTADNAPPTTSPKAASKVSRVTPAAIGKGNTQVAEVHLDMDEVRAHVSTPTPRPQQVAAVTHNKTTPDPVRPHINDVVKLRNGVAVAL